MKKLLYTRNMQPVQTGDVVQFSGRTWTVFEVCTMDDTLHCTGYVWVRSNDEQGQMVKVIGGWIKAAEFEVK
jgi:hypothetical protein